jgi:hypothetical protein
MQYVGTAVPARAAIFLTDVRMAVVFGAATRACWQVQARFNELSPADKTAKAYELALADYELNLKVLNHYPEVNEYVERCLLPAAIGGVVKTFDDALWFDTRKAIDVGGSLNPAPTPAISKVPGPPPLPPEA